MTKEKNTTQKTNQETELVIEMPKEVIVKLVQENLVKNYELLIWLFNVSTPIATALWSAFITINPGWKSSLFVSSLAFTIFSIVLGFLIWKNRKTTFSNSVKTKVKISKITNK